MSTSSSATSCTAGRTLLLYERSSCPVEPSRHLADATGVGGVFAFCRQRCILIPTMSVDVQHVQAFPSPDREPTVDEVRYAEIFDRLQLESGFKESELMASMLALGMQGDDIYFDNQLDQYLRYYRKSIASPAEPDYSHAADLGEFRGVMFAVAGAYYKRGLTHEDLVARRVRMNQSYEMLKKAALDMNRAGEPSDTGDVSALGTMLEDEVNFRPSIFNLSLFRKNIRPNLAATAFDNFIPEDTH